MLSEGIVEFFENLDPHSRDRFRRAYALSVSIGDIDLQAMTSAWLAHIEFHLRNYTGMVASANKCLAIFPNGPSSAHSRLFMVLANANLYGGNISRANVYFERSRAIAVAHGDRSTVGAIVYNKAVLMLNSLRLQGLVDLGDSMDEGLVSMAVESASAFQAITENKSLEELPLMSEARLAMVKGDFASALKTIDKVRGSTFRHRGGAKDPLLDIEYVLCLMRTGDSERARGILEGMDLSRYVELDNDDRVIFLSQLIKIRSEIGCDLQLEDLDALLQVSILEFSDELASLREAISLMTFQGDTNG
jgi:hypothetical protein